jgi:hypothetical protein
MIDEWEPEEDYSWMLSPDTIKGRSKEQQLVDSGDTISFFIEEDAVDPNTGIR